jgi:hypothetical protein
MGGGELVALLLTVTLPFTLWASVGANATFSVADWFGFRVVPPLTPLALNPLPDTVTLEIVTSEFPAFVRAVLKDPVFPRVTFPKPRLVGLMPRVNVAAIPAPLRPTEVGEVGALLIMETLPDAVPTEVGRKATEIVVCCPALTFKGSENPLTVKAGPDAATWVILSVAVPVFVMIKTWDNVLPTTLFPKLREAELT